MSSNKVLVFAWLYFKRFDSVFTYNVAFQNFPKSVVVNETLGEVFPTLNKPLFTLALKVKIWLGTSIRVFSNLVNIDIYL